MYYRLSKNSVQELVYKYAHDASNKSYHEVWDEYQIAGDEWMQGFIKRQPGLSI